MYEHDTITDDTVCLAVYMNRLEDFEEVVEEREELINELKSLDDTDSLIDVDTLENQLTELKFILEKLRNMVERKKTINQGKHKAVKGELSQMEIMNLQKEINQLKEEEKRRF